MMHRIAISAACLLSLMAAQCLGFGNKGHETVGSIADKKLTGTPTGEKVKNLLGGLTLKRAALLADTLKSFNGHPEAFVLSGHPALTTQLRAFLIANPKTAPKFNHHDYHYTDVPVEGSSKYNRSYAVGRFLVVWERSSTTHFTHPHAVSDKKLALSANCVTPI